MRIPLCLLLGAAFAGQAQPPSGASPVPFSPRAIEMPNPDYSGEARAAGLEGLASVYVEIDQSGAITTAHLLQGLGMGLDDKALDAARRWKFDAWTSPVVTTGLPSRSPGSNRQFPTVCDTQSPTGPSPRTTRTAPVLPSFLISNTTAAPAPSWHPASSGRTYWRSTGLTRTGILLTPGVGLWFSARN